MPIPNSNTKRRSNNFQHGMSASPTYKCWSDMWARTRATKGRRFKDYASRGITVCEQWRDFRAFLADMGERPSSKHTIERLNNNGNYEPTNCIWATLIVQANNKRSNHTLTHNGESLTIAQWARRTGLRERTIRRRIVEYGWSVSDALTKELVPASKPRFEVLITIDNATHSLIEWARLSGIPSSTIYNRRARGKTGHDLIIPSRASKRTYAPTHG